MIEDPEIGDVVEVTGGDQPINATIERIVEVAGASIVLLRPDIGDGTESWVYCQREDGAVIDVPALARAILAGLPVRQPVAAVEQILAGAVLMLADIKIADSDEEVVS